MMEKWTARERRVAAAMSFDERLRNERADRLFQAMMSLETIEEFYRFFEDLCTVTELQTLSQRFHVAQLLYDEATYEEVAGQTGMSSATISRIKRFLHYGADGYRLAIERLRSDDQKAEDGNSPRRPRFE